MEGKEVQRCQTEENDLEERKEYLSMKNDDQQRDNMKNLSTSTSNNRQDAFSEEVWHLILK